VDLSLLHGKLAVRNGFTVRLMRRLPEPVATNPERILINLGCVLIGLSAFVGQRSPALDRLWLFPPCEWSVAMITGGLAVLIGMARVKVALERVGYMLILPACLLYGVGMIVGFGWRGVIYGLVFIGSPAPRRFGCW
jgi:hypothetical protein